VFGTFSMWGAAWGAPVARGGASPSP